jgi:hypothetical protein
MRSHRHILREIAHRNLDPKVPYVVGENNLLVRKDEKLDGDALEESQESTEGDTSIESDNVQSDVVQEEKPKKRVPPPRKKKEVVTTE